MNAHQIYFHIAWTTLGRRPMINSPTRAFLDDFIRRIALRERVHVLGLAILQTHVHVIVQTAARYDLPQLLQAWKGGSSFAASRIEGNQLGLRWSREYSVTSVSPRLLSHALRYVRTQELHHPEEAVV
jgi:REP element-mobilizing transposase RayT